jgi:hypothetical protein
LGTNLAACPQFDCTEFHQRRLRVTNYFFLAAFFAAFFGAAFFAAFFFVAIVVILPSRIMYRNEKEYIKKVKKCFRPLDAIRTGRGW